MHDDLTSAIDELFPALRSDLEELVRVDSISAPGFDPGRVRQAAEVSAAQLERSGLKGVRILEMDGSHPAVFAETGPPAPDAPTVLLYAHYDVQPPGPAELWSTPPFEPTESRGRLYGRGTADDKVGIVIHTGAIQAHEGRPPVGVKVFLEGEEEIGSVHLDGFLERYRDLLAADVIVVADAANWSVGVPALTTSLRGLIDCTITVRTLEAGVHSGMWGGVFPDALSVLVRALASLHDQDGSVAVPGLVRGQRPLIDADEGEARRDAGVLAGVETIGVGSITERLWAGPALSILSIDAPPVAASINQLVPEARAKVSVRLAPGDDPGGRWTRWYAIWRGRSHGAPPSRWSGVRPPIPSRWIRPVLPTTPSRPASATRTDATPSTPASAAPSPSFRPSPTRSPVPIWC